MSAKKIISELLKAHQAKSAAERELILYMEPRNVWAFQPKYFVLLRKRLNDCNNRLIDATAAAQRFVDLSK